VLVFDNAFDELDILFQDFVLSFQLDFERGTILLFHAQLVLDKSFCQLADFDLLVVLLVDEEVSFKHCNGRFALDTAGVSLASQVEHDHWDAQELRVAAHVRWHWNL